MPSPQTIASIENEAVKQAWQVGGSTRYPARLPPRPRPPQEKRPDTVFIETDNSMSAFDEALEHVNWCRMQGMSPQDVGESINSRHVPHTWGAAIDILERYIIKMRRGSK